MGQRATCIDKLGLEYVVLSVFLLSRSSIKCIRFGCLVKLSSMFNLFLLDVMRYILRMRSLPIVLLVIVLTISNHCYEYRN